jgi:crotonobetainyl-CoA:carnitine CoA-transferase CaiB-like acyl-CoA transferase
MTPPPLAGLTVLETGVFVAAPFATMQLADLGARVIKVDNPAAPDPTRASGPFVHGHSSPFARLDRDEESVALDLKSDAGGRRSSGSSTAPTRWWRTSARAGCAGSGSGRRSRCGAWPGINDYGRVFTDEHLLERGFFRAAEHPDLGPVRRLGSPMRLDETPAVRGLAGPVLGPDTRTVLSELGYTDTEIDALTGR